MEKEASGEGGETAARLGQVAMDEDLTVDMSKRLAELREKEKRLQCARDEMNQKLLDSRQEIDGMKRDVEVLNTLEPSQYRQLERDMQESRPVAYREAAVI